MAPNKLSFTKINTYRECNYKYKLHYVERLRSEELKSSLVFGGCVDQGLNELLLSRDLDKALEIFRLAWEPYLTQQIKYTKSDVDTDLISGYLGDNPGWQAMYVKGNYLIKAFNEEILPKIKKTVLVQEIIEAHNEEGDSIVGALDAIVVWEDGKTYLIDNKTTSIKYTENSANESEQLALYHFVKKEEFKLDGVAFFTLNKILKKNVVKTCIKCGHIHEGTALKTCNIKVDGIKCNGDLDKTFKFSVEIKTIFGKPSEEVEQQILNEFDKVNAGIKNKKFERNEKACFGKFGKCDFFNVCKFGSEEGFIRKEDGK
jgi:hypothetical protein